MTNATKQQDLFELWQKMVNPGGYPLQSLMFPVLDAKEIDRKVAELQTVEQWLRANLNMLQMSIKTLEYQRALLKGGEKFQEKLREGRDGRDAAAAGSGEQTSAPSNPATWAWDMMAKAGQEAASGPKPAKPAKSTKPGKKRAAK
jgi:hypothetical protein